MKTRNKKLLAILLMAVMMLFVACSSTTNEAPDTDESVSVSEQVTEQKQEEKEPEVIVTPLACGDSIDNENFLMTFDSVELVDEYSYRTSEYSSTSIYVEDGYKALLLKGHFENKSTSVISQNAFAFITTVNDTYTVDGFDVRFSFERNKSFEIDPYTDLNYILYINIPEKLAEQFETVTFTIGFNNDMSSPSRISTSDGKKSIGADNLYALTSGLASAEAAVAEKKIAEIKAGETVVAKDYEFTLDKVELTYEVLPSNTSSVYSSYPADSGKVYVDVVVNLKNTMKRDIRIDETFTVSATYADGYEYSGFVVADDDNRFDWVGSYVAAKPLETRKMHGIIECPVEVDESTEPLSVLITLADGAEYKYIIR